MAEYIRIGTSYFKKVKRPTTSGDLKYTLLSWNRQTIVDDHGKSHLEDIEKYEGFIVKPSHNNYKLVIDNFYNEYKPLSHDLNIDYNTGSIFITLEFMDHIFSEQLEIGLDYLTILWLYPTQILPIFCLVSEERNTGKTTFLNWLKLIFEENMTMNKNEDFRSRFNSDWSQKIIVAIDEVLLDKREDSERIKNLSTSQTFKTEAKGIDKLETPFFGKFILCSNNENNFILIDENEIRYWVRKIPPITNYSDKFEKKLIEEIPQFVAFLNSRKIQSENKSRMWFTKKQIHTKALENLVKGTKANLEKELLYVIDDMLEEFELKEIKLTTGDLHDAIKDSYYKVSQFRIMQLVKEKWKLDNPNSSYDKYFKSVIPGSSEWQISSTNKKGRCYTFKRDFIKNLLNC